MTVTQEAVSSSSSDFAVALYYREGSSDKQYVVRIEESGNGLYLVNFAYGRRGSTLTTGTKTASPVPLAKARSIAEKLVSEKEAKGYTRGEDGQRFAGTEREGEVSPYLPQLLNPVDSDEAFVLVADGRFACQEKIDGRRLILERRGSVVRAVNRRGLFVGCPEHWGEGVCFDMVLDGEGVGATYFAFDVLEIDGRDLRMRPFGERYAALVELLATNRPRGIELVEATTQAAEKRAWIERFRLEHREGAVFKDVTAPYTPGRPASGGSQRKLKFTESGTFIVSSVSDSKRSVSVAAFNEAGEAVDLGNVTVPPNFDIPAVGQLAEVRFLYRYDQGALFQPVYLGVRDDLTASAATLSQIRRIKRADETAEEA